jgi:hypothetical protein
MNGAVPLASGFPGFYQLWRSQCPTRVPDSTFVQIDVISPVVVHGEMGAERRPWSFLGQRSAPRGQSAAATLPLHDWTAQHATRLVWQWPAG